MHTNRERELVFVCARLDEELLSTTGCLANRIRIDLLILVRQAHECLQCRELVLLCCDLVLLLDEGVDEHGGQLGVLHAFDFSLDVAECEQRLDQFDGLGAGRGA
jgi:hypothetical protein